MWENLGRVMAETMQIDRIIAEPDRIAARARTPSGCSRATRTRWARPSGVSLHMGNWELAAWPMTRGRQQPGRGLPLGEQSLCRPLAARACAATSIPAVCSARAASTAAAEEGQRTARLITDYVRKGGRLGMVCDLYDRTGLPVPFFGQPAPSVTIAGMIARRVGARIWLSRCLRQGRQSRFTIELKELKVPRTANPAEDVKWITAAMQRQFEAWIREAPEQWMWSNRRWS